MGLDELTKARLDRELAREREEQVGCDCFLAGPAANIAPGTRRAVLDIGGFNALRLNVEDGPKMKEQFSSRLPLDEVSPLIKAGVPPSTVVKANQWFKMMDEE